MFCRSISWIIYTLVPVVIATDCTHQHSIIGSDTEVMVCRSRTDGQELSTKEGGLEVKQTAPVNLGTLLDAGDGAMVTLVAGDTRLVAHRAVLAASSHVFAAVLRHDRHEASSDQVSITDVEGPVLRQLLAYMYSLQAPQMRNMTSHVQAAAKRYGFSGLEDVCKQQVAGHLTVETAAAAAVHALRHSCPSLKQAVAFIQAHTHQVMTTQGWEDAVISHPHSVVELTRLIAEPPAKTSASGSGRTGSGPTTSNHWQTHSHHRRTPDPAAPLPPPPHTCHTPPSDDDIISRVWRLSGKKMLQRLMQAYQRGALVETLLELLVDVVGMYWFWLGQTIMLFKPLRRKLVAGLRRMAEGVVELLKIAVMVFALSIVIFIVFASSKSTNYY